MAINVNIEKTILITPSTPPPDPTTPLPLSPLDNDRNLRITVRTLRFYPNKTTTPLRDPLVVVADALAKALSHYYQFAGTLVVNSSDSRLNLCCTAGDGVPLVGAVCASTIATVEDEPVSSAVLDRLAPDLAGGDELTHPLALQVTRFVCGGFVLGMCVHHAMCDGAGATQFLGAVAGYARGGVGVAVEPVWDRASLLRPRGPTNVKADFDHIFGFDKEGRASCLYDRLVGSDESIAKESFHVSDVCLERFRAGLAQRSNSGFTSFEALGAFIWQARVKASGISGDAAVKFAYSMSIKKLMNPAIPVGYWGNTCVPVYAKLTAKQLLDQPLWKTASLIRNSKRSISDEYVNSYVDFQECRFEEGITAGDRVSGFTDWRHLGHSEVDFGWGNPSNVLPLSLKLLGSLGPTFFLSYGDDDERKTDGFKVLACLPRDAVPKFRVAMEVFGCPTGMDHLRAGM